MLNIIKHIFSRAAHHTIIYCFTILFLQLLICNNFIYIEDTFFEEGLLFIRHHQRHRHAGLHPFFSPLRLHQTAPHHHSRHSSRLSPDDSAGFSRWK